MPLFWRLFLANALALVVGFFVAFVLPPIQLAGGREGILFLGFGVLLLVNAGIIGQGLSGIGVLRAAVTAPEVDEVTLPRGSAPDIQALADEFNAMLRRLEAERNSTARAALRAQEDERQRLALDLHDEVGQNLTFLLLRLRGVTEEAPEELQSDLEAVADAARLTLEHIRTLSRQLRPGVLGDLGLKPALASLVDDAGNLGLRTTFEFADWLPPEGERDLVVYRVVQEALTNVVEHAQATEVAVTVVRGESGIVVTIRDNGTGRLGPDGTGTTSMRERVRLVGGTFVRTAVPGAGTTITIEVPLSDTADAGPPTHPIPTVTVFPPTERL